MLQTNKANPAVRPDARRSNVLGVVLRAVLPVAVLAGGVVLFFRLSVPTDDSPPTEPSEQLLRTRAETLHVDDYQVVVTTHGVVRPHNEVALSAEVSGVVSYVSETFETGAYFSQGELLVELDSRDYETAVAIAEAEKHGAESALRLATLNHERAVQLFPKNVVTQAEVDLALANKLQAEAQLESTIARLEQTQRDLERTKITAPFDGRVLQKTVETWESVGAGAPLGVVFAVDFAEVRLPISGPELQYLDLPEFSDDAPVPVELRDAINPNSDWTWRAEIVRTEGSLDADSLELFAVARIIDPFGRTSGEPPLRIGQPVAATIEGSTLQNVTAIPRAAVRQLDQVYLIDSEELTLSPRTIEPLWSDKEYMIVRDSTIPDGSMISTTQLVYAPEGAKVEIIPEIDVTATAAANQPDADGQSVAN